METLAPPVVAVVVAHNPGPWFEETLASLHTQDYAELSVLVLDVASTEDLTARVAAVLPTAYVRHLDENRGFGAAVNEVMAMVDGADYYLVCHDDVALFPDTVHLLVEEAFRSNAGIVSPKVVSWADPERLVHVGMTVDKGGSVVDRVQPNEIDHGQHDAVRDVFVAPGGCTLVRADLFAELGGYDTAVVAMGEDLDLCWRAQVVGARIIVAPDARVRHLEELAGGARALDPALLASTGEEAAAHPVTLQELQRRHELLAVFKCYGRFHLIRVVPQVLVMAIGEVIVAELAGNRARARAVVRAWRWNLGRLAVIRGQRRELKSRRRLGDKEIRLLQIAGSARLSAYGRRVFQLGFHGAHADEMAAAEDGPDGEGELLAATAAVTSVAGPAAPSAMPGSAAPGSAPAGTSPVGASGRRRRLSLQAGLSVWVVAGLVVVLGSRGVLGGRLPAVGQFVPFPRWSSTVAAFVTGWHPAGVGSTAPATPALALSGLVGTVLLGAMGVTQKVLVFGCLPVGVWGVTRLLRPFGSPRASVVAGLAYLAVPLPYDALALGRWGAMVVYAGAPWAMARLFRATGWAPYAPPAAVGPPASGPAVGPDAPGASPSRAPSRRRRLADWSGRHVRLRSVVALGVLEAVMVSFVPAAALVVLMVAAALVLSCLLYGGWRPALRTLGLAAAATLVAAVICLPWVIGVLSAGRGAIAVFGVPVPASGAATWSALLRLAVGPIGDSPLAWGFALAALVPLVLGRGPRFRWAGRFWVVALVAWACDYVVGRGWTGSLAVDPLVLLGPAAVALAAAIGLGVAAFEEDLRSADFGWRQLVSVAAACAVVVGAVPTLISAVPGRWDLPVNDFSQSVQWMGAKASEGAFRVLWLGDTRALNQGSWAAGDGLAYATSEDGSPDARWLWNAPGPGPAAALADAVDTARAGRTDQLGRLLAPAGVRYVVLVTSLAPEIDGEQTPKAFPVPADLVPAMAHQLDLDTVVAGTGITVYANTAWIPVRAEVAGATAPGGASATAAALAAGPAVPPPAASPGAPLVAGATPVLPGPPAARAFSGPLSVGTVLTALAPAGRWQLTTSGGTPAPRASSFGWAGRYRVTAAGTGTLRFAGGWVTPVSFAVGILAWVLALALLAVRRLDISWRRIRTGRRRVGPRHRPATAGPPDRSDADDDGMVAGVVS